jgi:uncharacterized membrane protein YgcG
MDPNTSSLPFTVEKQEGHTASPGAASRQSPSSGSYPSGQGDSVSSFGEGRQPSPQQQQPQRHFREGERSAVAGGPTTTTTASSLFDTTALTSSASTPSGPGGRAMAHLLDSVASSSSSPPSSQTPPRKAAPARAAAGTAAAWRSPGKASGDGEGRSEHGQRHRHAHKQQQQLRMSSAKDTSSARHLRKDQHHEEDGEFTELLGETPVLSRTPPPPTQRSAASAPPHGSSPLTFSPAAQRSNRPPPPPQQQEQPSYHQQNDSSEVGTPTSTNAEDFSSVYDGSSVFSKDDFRPNAPGVSSLSGHGSNWASPTEVLRLRAMFHEVTARYQQEQARLRTELRKAQEEIQTYAGERARVQQLQKAYAEGLAHCETVKRQQALWAEEKALQQLQLEKMMVENQRLQLFIAKKQKLHRARHDVDAIFVPTESQERIQAAVQGIHAATAAAASEARLCAAASHSPLPTMHGPPMSANGGVMHSAARPASAPPLPSTQARGVTPNMLGGFHFPSTSERQQTGLGTTVPCGTAEVQSSPYTLFSSESTPRPQTSPPNFTSPQPQLCHETFDSGSVREADHTQLPGAAASAPTTAAAAARGGPARAEEVEGVSPSTDASGSLLSSPTPLQPRALQRPSQALVTAHRSDSNVVRAVKKQRSIHQGSDVVGGDGVHEQRRSSSLVTPSPSVSGPATTPTSSSSPACASRRGGESGSSSTGGSSTSGGNIMNIGAIRDGAGHHGNEARCPLTDYGRDRDGEGRERDEETGGGTSTELDPSYARGVTDISSSSGSHMSAFSVSTPAATMVMGRLLDARTHTPQRQQQQQPPPGMHEEASSYSPLGCDPLTSTTACTGDTLRGAASITSAAAAARVSVATATTTATTTTTTNTDTATTTPSLLPSAAATPSHGHSSGSTSSSTWSLQYLYHLPRTPAEALQEELRMMKALRRLEEENESLEARLQHLTTLKAMDADQREQRLLRLAQEHEQARSRAAHWELTAAQLQSEVAALERQCAEAVEVLDRVLITSRQQQLQAQSRLMELEAGSRAALTATREETLMQLSVLRRMWAETVATKQQQCHVEKRGTDDGNGDNDDLQRTIETLRTELHAARSAQTELHDRHHATKVEAAARVTHLENVLVRTHDALDRMTAERNAALQRIDQLEAEVERLREAAVTREACMHAMEERLRIATDELSTQHAQLEDASTWQARALGAEEELGTQRSFWEKEVSVWKTATCNMQDQHHRDMEKAAKRYEKLVVRFEAMRLRLTAALSGNVCGNLGEGGDTWASTRAPTGGGGGESSGSGGKERQKKSPANTPENSPNPTVAKGQQRLQRDVAREELIVPADAALQHTAKLVCDSVQALRTSVETTDRLAKSLDRTRFFGGTGCQTSPPSFLPSATFNM